MDEIKVIQGDCREVLKGIPDKSVDLILTDVPYNVDKDFQNDNLDKIEFQIFHLSYLKELRRIIKPKKPILIFFNTGESLMDFMQVVGQVLQFKKMLFWYKPNDCSMPLSSVLRTSEALLMFSSNGSINYQSEDNTHDVLISNHIKKDESFYHPSVKDIRIMKKLVKAFSMPGDLVLDCFAGSGSTLVACKELKRKAIGIEIEPEYITMINKRLDKTLIKTELGDFALNEGECCVKILTEPKVKEVFLTINPHNSTRRPTMENKITVKDMILILHEFDLDSEVRIKNKDGEIIPGAKLFIIKQEGLGALFG